MRTLIGFLALLVASNAHATQCGIEGSVALQVLGSGGPIADDGRASSSYLVRVDGRSQFMIDAGGGAFLRFGEAGARFEDLDFVGLSHFHTDHSIDFAALLKSGVFSSREGDLVVAGPGGGGPFPGLTTYLEHLIGKGESSYPYLSSYLEGGDTVLVPRQVDGEDTVVVYDSQDARVLARRVPHGIVPAVGFRVEVGGFSIVFASDQNGSDPGFVEFARDADLLVMHLVIPEDAGPRARQLHAVPSVVGRIAREANARYLVLSHFMARSLLNLDENVEIVATAAELDPLLASDLRCFELGRPSD